MKFGYGGFRGETGEFALRTFTTTGKRGENKLLESVTRTLAVEFVIVRDGQAAITSRFSQIENSIRFDGRDVGFYLDSGAPSSIFIRNANSTSGVYITEFPGVVPEEADYATHLKGQCAFAADFSPVLFGGGSGGGGNQNQLSGFEETVQIQGDGGPRYGIAESDTGKPSRWQLTDYTPCFATQAGRATFIVERPTWPNPTQPYWPRLLNHEARSVQRSLREAGGQYECTTSWNYTFEGTEPFTGSPTPR